VNVTGELGKWVEADLLKNITITDYFYRHTLSHFVDGVRPIHRFIFVNDFELSLVSLRKKSNTYSALEERWGVQQSTNSMSG